MAGIELRIEAPFEADLPAVLLLAEGMHVNNA